MMSTSEGMRVDPVLEPMHKIFLSHSGSQKDFTDYLCGALENRFHYPFYDRSDESLPKGERFPELIVEAAQQCKMLIVVVSKEYFMSKWAMIELNAFVQAHKLNRESKRSNSGPKIFPLFYYLSASDLKDEAMQKEWFERWETLAAGDPKERIRVCDWKDAFDGLTSFNGLADESNRKGMRVYQDRVVSYVCKAIPPDIKWDDSHVQGKSRICEVIYEKIEKVGPPEKYKAKVVGLYGVGGIGKTTTCKTLCNELSSEYEGKVCYIEFPSVASKDWKELFQNVLKDLTMMCDEVIQGLNAGQCQYALKKRLPMHRTFLAIDNISENEQSIQQAKVFLGAGFHEDSLVIVTARSQSLLVRMGIDGDACLEMPELEMADAVNLFLLHAAGGKQSWKDEDMQNILTCVRRCHFSKGYGQGRHYHPLALEALGFQLGYHGESPSEWVENLPRFKNFDGFPGKNPVFGILRSSFDLLSASEQNLFMDVGYFAGIRMICGTLEVNANVRWLCDVHKEDEGDIKRRLDGLKRRGLLQDVDSTSGRISMHDLYLEFVRLEAGGSLDGGTDLEERRWVVVDNREFTKLESKPRGGCWPKLIRLAISEVPFNSSIKRIESLERMNWDYFSNIEVLQLIHLAWVRGALNLEHLICLRSLEVYGLQKLYRIEGLGELKNLTHFRWVRYRDPHEVKDIDIIGQLPTSLKALELNDAGLVLKSDIFARCTSLLKLVLFGVKVGTLDLSSCLALESVELEYVRKLRTVSGLASRIKSRLQCLWDFGWFNLVAIPGTDHLIAQRNLSIGYSAMAEVPNLLVCGNDCFPRQLRELTYICWSTEQLNLDGLNELEVLDLRFCRGLTSLDAMGGLPALRHLSLCWCENLLRLPDLSKSRNLERLDLHGCGCLKLHEEDIQMLSELPLLQAMFLSGPFERGPIELDVVRRNLRLLLDSLDWQERALGALPITINEIGCEEFWKD